MKKAGFALFSIAIGGLSLAGATALAPIGQACAQQAHMSFVEDIAPIIKGWCVSCHQPGGEGYNASGLDLTNYDGLMKGTKFGAMVIPGQPDTSSLIALIDGRSKINMPFGHKALPGCLRNNIWTWIFEGAKNN